MTLIGMVVLADCLNYTLVTICHNCLTALQRHTSVLTATAAHLGTNLKQHISVLTATAAHLGTNPYSSTSRY